MSNELETDFEAVRKQAVAKLEQAGKLIQEAGELARLMNCGFRQMDQVVTDNLQTIIDDAGLVTEQFNNDGWSSSEVCW